MKVGPLGAGDSSLPFRSHGFDEEPFPPDFKLHTAVFLMGNPDYLFFKQRVLDRQIRRARDKGRTFVPTLPEAQLGTVEHGQKMTKAAAAHCRALLVAARAALDSSMNKRSSISALSGYRPVERERELWDGYFEKYYLATHEGRYRLAGGPHSEEAVEYLASYVSERKAAPGYGNHSAGVAMDFATTFGRRTYSASMAQKEGWRKTPFHVWLVKNAKEFGFHPYVKEPWHWEFKG